MEDKSIQVQKLVMDYFKDVDDKLFMEIADAFTFGTGTQNDEVSKLMTKFIEDNGLVETMADQQYNKINGKLFMRNPSGMQMIELLKTAFIVGAYNRFRNALKSNTIVSDLDIKLQKATDKVNKLNLTFLKKEALECYEGLNRHENYFMGEEEDAERVEYIEKIKWMK